LPSDLNKPEGSLVTGKPAEESSVGFPVTKEPSAEKKKRGRSDH